MRTYKHLGTYLSADGMVFHNAVHLSQSALAAFAPLAFKVFGSKLIADPYKFVLMRSLVQSVLLFNMHV